MNLVSGATGIIGSHVVMNLLKNGEKVIACAGPGNNKQKLKELFGYYGCENLYDKIEWRELILNDIFSIESALENVETVYHCAGLVSFRISDRKKLYEINEEGTANMVNACLQKKVVLCHVSSICTLNNADIKNEIDERVFWKQSGKESEYAISKYKAENEVWRGIEEGLNAVVVNPGVVLSPGFWDQSSSQIFKVCDKGVGYYTKGFSAYITANDTAKIMIELVQKKCYANRFILIEKNYTYQEILENVSFHIGKTNKLKEIGKTSIHLLYYLEQFLSFFGLRKSKLHKPLIHTLFNQQKYSNQKIHSVLNYKFESVNSEIERIAKIYRKEHSFGL